MCSVVCCEIIENKISIECHLMLRQSFRRIAIVAIMLRHMLMHCIILSDVTAIAPWYGNTLRVPAARKEGMVRGVLVHMRVRLHANTPILSKSYLFMSMAFFCLLNNSLPKFAPWQDQQPMTFTTPRMQTKMIDPVEDVFSLSCSSGLQTTKSQGKKSTYSGSRV